MCHGFAYRTLFARPNRRVSYSLTPTSDLQQKSKMQGRPPDMVINLNTVLLPFQFRVKGRFDKGLIIYAGLFQPSLTAHGKVFSGSKLQISFQFYKVKLLQSFSSCFARDQPGDYNGFLHHSRLCEH